MPGSSRKLLILSLVFFITPQPGGSRILKNSEDPRFEVKSSEFLQIQLQKRMRAREMGIQFGVLPVGKWNAITDVVGVKVGHTTIVEGRSIRTGVTAILPHGENVFQQKVPAAVVVGNGFGKFVGSTQVNELGRLETPVVLTNTLSTFAAADAVVKWTLKQAGNAEVRSVNPVVGECNDAFLNDIRKQVVNREHVFSAIESAKTGKVAEGCVGAGTGTQCLGWKGGIGTSSRKLPASLGGYTVGVLVQTNFGGILAIAGAPVGKELGRYYLKRHVENIPKPEEGSCLVVVATDAPLNARQLKRLAKRALLGLSMTGSLMAHGSGDYVLAFSTAEGMRSKYVSRSRTETQKILRDDAMSPLFQAVKEATEESVINSMFQATTTKGHRGHTTEAIPLDKVKEVLKKYRAISDGNE